MIILTQLVCFVTVLLVLLLHISSILNNDGLLDLLQTPVASTSSSFNPYSRVTLKQQLKSRLPNLNEPIRPITFGKLNFLHTTDTHGWFLGHLNQRQYSADWGDFISFHSNLKDIVNSHDGDLLLIDTGDRHDGNGLSDLTTPNGEYSSKIFSMLDYDLITVGNHELYKADVSKFEFENTVPRYAENFVSTNVQYKSDSGEFVPFGNTHRYFQTKVNGYNVLAFSFLFNFQMANERIKVTPISTLIHQSWFLKLLEKYSTSNDLPVDAIVIFGHLPVSHDWLELYELHAVFRKYFPHSYIQYFGGHSHIRDFSVIDRLSTALQSGRYCETVGFLSIDTLPEGNDDDQEGTHYIKENVHRRYIDFNIHSFMNHTNHTNLAKYNTEKGLFVSNQLAHYATKLELDEYYGSVPHSFYMYAADYSNNDPKSLLRFLENDILPQLEPKSCTASPDETTFETSNDRIILINTGGIRYDLYKGDFNRNSLFTVSPFQNKWKVAPNVPTEIALQIQDILNHGDFIIASSHSSSLSLKSPYQLAFEAKVALSSTLSSSFPINETATDRKPLSYGYTTVDDFGSSGDDTIHKMLPSYYVPNVIQSHNKKSETNSEFTDVVFYDFIEPFIIDALKVACNGDDELFNEITAHVQYYNDCAAEFNLGQLLKKYAQVHWN